MSWTCVVVRLEFNSLHVSLITNPSLTIHVANNEKKKGTALADTARCDDGKLTDVRQGHMRRTV